MNDSFNTEFYKTAFKSMKKGEISFVKFSKEYHRGVYFTQTQLSGILKEKQKLNEEFLIIKLTIVNIKRNLMCEDSNSY